MARATGVARVLGPAVLALLACSGEPAAPRSVICIVVDTLRADRIGTWGYTARPTSPHLDAWLERARIYERAFATSPWTLPTMGSLLTGRWPVYHGAGRRERHEGWTQATALRPALPTLAERFQAADHATAAIVSNAFLAPDFGVARGFSHYDFEASGIAQSRRADEVVRRALAWLDARGERPFLLLIHFFDPHMGYEAPPPFRGRFSEGLGAKLALPVRDVTSLRRKAASLSETDRHLIAAAYDEEVAFVDAQLGVLLDALERRELLREALVVLTSDHGEELFEHGGFEHGHALWQELLHVPLAFWGPGVQTGRESAAVSVADLAPTLLEAAGLAPLPVTDGLSLWPNLARGAALPTRSLYAEGVLYGIERRAVIQWPDKLVWTPVRNAWQLFDLAEDPGERRVDTPVGSPAERALRRAALALWSGRAAGAPPGGVPLEGPTRAALEELGYLE